MWTVFAERPNGCRTGLSRALGTEVPFVAVFDGDKQTKLSWKTNSISDTTPGEPGNVCPAVEQITLRVVVF